MLTVIVPAAGLSSRMGSKNKLLLPVLDNPLLAITLQQLLKLQDVQIIVVLGHEAALLRPLLDNMAVTIAYNPNYHKGLTSSIQAGVRAATDDSQGFMICLSDMPLIQTATYQELSAAFLAAAPTAPRTIVQPVFEGQPGNPVIFSAQYKNEILALDFPEGCKPIVQANRAFVQKVAVHTNTVLQDVDTADAYESLKRALKQG